MGHFNHRPGNQDGAKYSRLWLFFALIFTISAVQAQLPEENLFIDAQSAPETLGQVESSIVLRQRGVTLAPNALTPESQFLLLNLFEDTLLTAELDHVEYSGNGSWAWIGNVEGEDGSQVTFVVDNGIVSGTINLPTICYHIRHIQAGLHVIREIDLAALQDTVNGGSQLPISQPQILENSLFEEDEQVLVQSFELNSQSFLPEEQQVFELVNQERAVRGLHLLAADGKLIAAARAHSQDMSQNNYFDHTNLQGKSAGQRMLEAGYAWNSWGENIAWGYTTPAAVMNGWMNSPGHKANILGTSFCDIGVGYESQGRYWTQNFGRKQGVFSCPEPQAPANPPADPTPPTDPDPVTPAPAPSNELSNGQAKSFAVGRNETKEYVIQVPPNAVNLKVSLSGSGDGDLYVKRTAIQWPGDFGRHNEAEFKAPFNFGTNESVVFAAPAQGTWHVLIHGYSQAQGNIVATWETETGAGDNGNQSDPPPVTDNQLTNGGTKSVTLNRNAVKEFTMAIPDNARNLVVSITGSGDADLYVKRTNINWPQDYGPHNTGNFKALWAIGSNEAVTFPAPTAGTWHILLHGYTAAEVVLKATWQ